MSSYRAPLMDMMFALRQVIGTDFLRTIPRADGLELDDSTIESILTEGANMAEGHMADINHSGDQEGCTLKDGVVTTPKGWKDTYNAYRDGGWNGVPFTTEFGGQGLPWSVAFPVQEMWQSANMAFGLCPLLNQGAVEAIAHHGSDAQKQYYLPKLISGEWTGTMNLTEPGAGSDLAQVRTRAERAEGGAYKISGEKIFITYGEHDLADNIIHLVLARLPDGPAGVKGISLFIVPKFLEDGTRNEGVKCLRLEEKMGIHASPTCAMSFNNAIAFLVGEEHEGIKYMFTMMNNARLSVGLQGVAIAERASQVAEDYARERVQGGKPIIEHGDVKRMLLEIRACTQAGRLMAYEAALALDKGDRALVDLFTPVVKGWCTERAQDSVSNGVQVHGGMGFIEEVEAAQFVRDARILPIYEGTTGIQAKDLVFRKVVRDEGAAMIAWLNGQKPLLDALEQSTGNDLSAIGQSLQEGFDALHGATGSILSYGKNSETEALDNVSGHYLMLTGDVMAGTMLARAALVARNLLRDGQTADFSPDFLNEKIRIARFFADNVLPMGTARKHSIRRGSESIVRPL